MVKVVRNLVLALAASVYMSGSAGAETLKWGEHLPECCSMYAEAT